MPIPRTKHAGAADRCENSELINALMQPQTDSHPAAAALEDSAFSAFQFMVESRLLGTTAPAGYAVRRFVQMPTTGFYALRLEIATDCEHLGPGQAELPALECGLGELSPSTWRRGCEVRVNRRMSGKMLGGAEHCASFKVHPPTQLGQHVFGKVQALPQTQLLFGIALQAVQSIYFLLDSLVNNPGQPVMKYSDMLEPLMTDDSTIGIEDVTDYLKSIIVTTTDVGQVVGLKPSQNNNGLKVVTKAREECAAPRFTNATGCRPPAFCAKNSKRSASSQDPEHPGVLLFVEQKSVLVCGECRAICCVYRGCRKNVRLGFDDDRIDWDAQRTPAAALRTD